MKMTGYLVLPCLEKPKYVLPLRSRKLFSRSLGLYSPFLLKRKAQICALKMVQATSVSKYLLKNKVTCEQYLDKFVPYFEEISNWIHNAWASRQVTLAFLVGDKDKVTIQVMNESVGTIGFVKVGASNRTKQKIANEHRMLYFLNQTELRHVVTPRILAFEENGRLSFLATDCPMETLKGNSISLRPVHVKGLTELFRRTSVSVPFTKSTCYETISGRLNLVLPSICSSREESTIRNLVDKVGRNELSLGLCHYDFKPWNVRILNDGRVYIFDWELAQMNWTPLWDIFHFILQPSILIGNRGVGTMASKLLKKNTLISSYMQALELESQTYMPLLFLYLCDVTGYYQQERQNQCDQQAEHYIAQVRKLIKYLVGMTK